MKYKIFSSMRSVKKHDALLVCLTAEAVKERGDLGRTLRGLGIDLAEMERTDGFKGRATQDLYVRLAGRKERRVLLLGLGKKSQVDAVVLRRRLERAGAILRARRIARPVVLLPELPVEAEVTARAAVMGLGLGSGRRVTYAKVKEGAPFDNTQIVIPGCDEKAIGRAAGEAEAMGEIILEARSWVEEPANRLGPEDLAKRASGMCKAHGVACEVWKEARIGKEGMNLLLAVGRGSSRGPRMVRMTYEPAGAKAHVALVGKGIVFDTGGLSLKPAKSMIGMKTDMAGAAVVAGVIAAAAKLRLPVRVTALAPIAENTPSADSYRPGDVISGRGGRSVEVISTDAEGRLVMADALTLAAENKPDYVVDVATLTGSCMVALGTHTAGLWANDDALAERLLAAARRSGESLWRMPLLEEIAPQLRSEVADLRNAQSDAYGGAIAAALFLREFVGKRRWAHLDIAGPAYNERRSEAGARGATGYGITTIVGFLESL